MRASDALQTHLKITRKRMAEGKVIPFLGAGANLCDRPAGARWLQDGYLPSGLELADYLASEYAYPRGAAVDLVRVSQYVALKGGEQALFDSLRELFVRDYESTSLHAFLAEAPAILSREGRPAPRQLIVSTNYDDALERAFDEAGEEYDLVYYAAERERPGRFVHVRPDGEHVPIPRPTSYHRFSVGERTVILKIHGAVDRDDEASDSYVITEDHYIDYLARTNIAKLIPAQLMARMMNSHFLFLGYGLRDWNLRVILHHIWSQRARPSMSWAIQRNPDPIDELFWQNHKVEIVDVALSDWVEAMRAASD